MFNPVRSAIKKSWEFLAGPVVRTWRFHCYGPGLIPGQETKIPQAPHAAKKRKEINRLFFRAVLSLQKN